MQLASSERVLTRAIADRAFPAAQYAVTFHSRTFSGALGNHTYEPNSPAITADSLFDVASLTKVVAGTAMAMLLYQQGGLCLDQPLAEIVPEFITSDRGLRRREITLRMLLAHSSGLPGYARLFDRARTRDELLQLLYAVQLTAAPMQRAEYSDLGFMLLGEAMARVAGEPLHAFLHRRVLAPLEMTDTHYNPPSELRNRCVPTDSGNDFRHRLLQGEVHDEHAFLLGGVSAHAGLFSTALDLARFARCMTREGAPLFTPIVLRIFTERQLSPRESSRALGWDTPSLPSQSGKYFSPCSYGHLGFTGTSLWIDPDADLSITLLTNRVWPDRASQLIKQVRPAFHDAVREELGLT